MLPQWASGKDIRINFFTVIHFCGQNLTNVNSSTWWFLMHKLIRFSWQLFENSSKRRLLSIIFNNKIQTWKPYYQLILYKNIMYCVISKFSKYFSKFQLFLKIFHKKHLKKFKFGLKITYFHYKFLKEHL